MNIRQLRAKKKKRKTPRTILFRHSVIQNFNYLEMKLFIPGEEKRFEERVSFQS